MEDEQVMRQRVVDAVTRFQKDQMSVSAESVSVDFHPSSLVVTLQGITCPAEQNYARDKEARDLLERFHKELFEATKPVLEGAIGEILERSVQRSKLSVDPGSGDGVIVFTFKDKPCLHEEGKN